MKKEIYLYEFILLIFIIILKIFAMGNSLNNILTINIVFWTAFTAILYFRLGFARNNNYLKISSIRIVLIILLVYFIVNFLGGLLLGFTRNSLASNLITGLIDMLPYIIIYTLMEISRYIILSKKNGTLNVIILTILYIIFGIIMAINGKFISGYRDIFIIVSTNIIPIIANELLYTYMTKNISYLPSLIFKLCIELYIYVFGILPALGNYILSIIGIIFPFITFISIRRLIKYKDQYDKKFNKSLRITLVSLILLFTIVLTSLVSGIFNYQLIAIASNSMNPTYYRGDAVLIHKKDASKIKTGDVLAFDTGQGIVTHRVINIRTSNGNYIFVTKGDANDSIDSYDITNKNVIGTVDYVLKYSGYPTVFITELFEKR